MFNLDLNVMWVSLFTFFNSCFLEMYLNNPHMTTLLSALTLTIIAYYKAETRNILLDTLSMFSHFSASKSQSFDVYLK